MKLGSRDKLIEGTQESFVPSDMLEANMIQLEKERKKIFFPSLLVVVGKSFSPKLRSLKERGITLLLMKLIKHQEQSITLEVFFPL